MARSWILQVLDSGWPVRQSSSFASSFAWSFHFTCHFHRSTNSINHLSINEPLLVESGYSISAPTKELQSRLPILLD